MKQYIITPCLVLHAAHGMTLFVNIHFILAFIQFTMKPKLTSSKRNALCCINKNILS